MKPRNIIRNHILYRLTRLKPRRVLLGLARRVEFLDPKVLPRNKLIRARGGRCCCSAPVNQWPSEHPLCGVCWLVGLSLCLSPQTPRAIIFCEVQAGAVCQLCCGDRHRLSTRFVRTRRDRERERAACSSSSNVAWAPPSLRFEERRRGGWVLLACTGIEGHLCCTSSSKTSSTRARREGGSKRP